MVRINNLPFQGTMKYNISMKQRDDVTNIVGKEGMKVIDKFVSDSFHRIKEDFPKQDTVEINVGTNKSTPKELGNVYPTELVNVSDSAIVVQFKHNKKHPLTFIVNKSRITEKDYVADDYDNYCEYRDGKDYLEFLYENFADKAL